MCKRREKNTITQKKTREGKEDKASFTITGTKTKKLNKGGKKIEKGKKLAPIAPIAPISPPPQGWKTMASDRRTIASLGRFTLSGHRR